MHHSVLAVIKKIVLEIRYADLGLVVHAGASRIIYIFVLKVAVSVRMLSMFCRIACDAQYKFCAIPPDRCGDDFSRKNKIKNKMW